MKNPYFVDPEVVSKQEILVNLKEGHIPFSPFETCFSLESIEWLDSITLDNVFF